MNARLIIRWNSLWLLTALVVFAASPLQAEDSAPWRPDTPKLVLATMVLHGEDTGAALFLAIDRIDQTPYVGLPDFAAAARLLLEPTELGWRLVTPIGTATIGRDEVRYLEEDVYVAVPSLAEKLASDIAFDGREFSLVMVPPWPPQTAASGQDVIQPSASERTVLDAKAPSASVSQLRSELVYQVVGDSEATSLVTDVGGRLADGFWRVRHRNSFNGNAVLEDYTWLNAGENYRLLLGNQNLSVTRLLPSFDFTGGQWAWSNRPQAVFDEYLPNNALIGVSAGSIRTFQGDGPAGGTAELRIEEAIVARTIIGLDGRYEFRDVDIPSAGSLQIEVWVFERGTSSAPAKVDDYSGYNSARLLPKGTITHYAGLGVLGNVIEDDSEIQDDTAFFQSRYAPAERLTLQAAGMLVDGDTHVSLSALSNLGPLGFVGAEIASNDSSNQAWRIELMNEFDQWFWRGNFLHRDSGFSGDAIGDRDDRFFETGYISRNRWLRLSVVTRDVERPEDELSNSYALPAMAWRVNNQFALSARPDIEGDYVSSARWKINRSNELVGYVQPDVESVQWTRQFGTRRQLISTVTDRAFSDVEQSVILRQYFNGLGSLGWAVGASHSEGRLGGLAEVDYEFMPGVRARAGLFRAADQRGPRDTEFSLNVIADLSFTQGGVTRGQYRRNFRNTGSVAGHLRLPDQHPMIGLEDVVVLIDGQPRGNMEADGSYLVSQLPPGIYRVRLDAGTLPLEVHTSNRSFYAEVKAGSVTTVDFDVAILFGLAGQVTDQDGQPVMNASMALVDGEGVTQATAMTNQFGYYRMDQIPTGRYRLLVGDDPAQPLATRIVELADDFLFGQDVVVASEETSDE